MSRTSRVPGPSDARGSRRDASPYSDGTAPATPRVPLQVTHNCLIASIQVDLDEAVLSRFQSDLLDSIRGTRARTVLLDLGGLSVLDAEEFVALRRIAAMAKWMGARPVFVGLRAGIASALVDLNVDVSGLETAPSLERALELAAVTGEASAGVPTSPAGPTPNSNGGAV